MFRMHARRVATAITLAATLIASGGSAAARPEQPPAQQTSTGRPLFLGQWELDLTRMPANYGPPPRRVLFTFEDAGADYWRTTIDITAPDGNVRHSAVRYRRDGSAAVGEGDAREADTAAFASPAPNVLVMNLAKGRQPGSVRVYTIAPDGQAMTESAAAIDDQGAPFVRTFHFRRIN